MTRGKPLLTKENPCHTLHCRKHCLESARDLLFDLRQQSRCGIWLTSLLHEPNSLSPGERELIATYVSSRNDCYFCQTSHGSAAAYHLGDANVVAQVKADFESAPVSAKLKALLAIAGKVQCDGKLVTAEDVERAKHEGATELEIHDTVLRSPAAFCMYNRYVDGLGTWQPRDADMYAQMGRHLADHGYQSSSRS